MTVMTIGEVAEASGVAASAIRYYEKAGLLPAPPRASRARRYDADAVGRLEVILLAREAGFTIGETRTFLTGIGPGAPPAAHWAELAARKLKELDAEIARRKRMKALLRASFQCGCVRLEDCERLMGRKRLGSAKRGAAAEAAA
jgi:MerR family transcriptional regulator, redox-sensitive transcriptional activator SoxR